MRDEPADPARDGGLVRVRIDLAYDGRGYAGWAQQPGQSTIESIVASALATVCRLSAPPRLTVAGRTDAGVHARGQVCHVDLEKASWEVFPGRSSRTPGAALASRLNGLLPPTVRVRRVAEVPPDFDARFSALGRRYVYRICDDPSAADPLRRDVLSHQRRLDVAAMQAAGLRLLGEHDFAAYCRPRAGATTIRRLRILRCCRSPEGLVEVELEADAFCHSMVRAVVGALAAVGEGRRPVEWPGSVLVAGLREPGVTVLPPDGLTLEEVTYPPDDHLASRARESRNVRVVR